MPTAAALLLWSTLGLFASPKLLLRMATVAPDGTSLAREMKAFSRDVETSTAGAVQIKWYFNGLAGDEIQALDWVRRGRLDGAAGAILCQHLAPSLNVARIEGMFQSRGEALYVLRRLGPTFEKEFQDNGFTALTLAEFGTDVLFSRQPVQSMADLARGRYWIWNYDDVLKAQLPAIGVRAVPLPLDEAARAYDAGRIDGFLATPLVALTFQWSARAHYFSDLRTGILIGCVAVANRALGRATIENQQAVRAAGAKLAARLEDMTRVEDERLVGGLFEKQGVKPVPVSEAFRSRFLERARIARSHLEKLVPQALIERVLALLADYRAEHGAPTRGQR